MNVNFAVRLLFCTHVFGQNGLRRSQSIDQLSGYIYISRFESNTQNIAEKMPAYDVSRPHALKPPGGLPSENVENAPRKI